MENKAAIDPTSDPVSASHTKTELEPSAPAIIPVKLTEDIGSFADAEAGASLGDIMSSTSNSSSSAESASNTASTQSDARQSKVDDDIGFAADAEAGASLTEIMPTRDS